jgi:hypothetical protein
MADLPAWLDDLVPLRDASTPPRVVSRAQAHRLGFTDAAIRHRLRRGSTP